MALIGGLTTIRYSDSTGWVLEKYLHTDGMRAFIWLFNEQGDMYEFGLVRGSVLFLWSSFTKQLITRPN